MLMLRLRLNSRLEQKVRDSIRPSEPYREYVTVSNEIIELRVIN